nr:hypothetical protein CFP56_09215 [Quercus suber]
MRPPRSCECTLQLGSMCAAWCSRHRGDPGGGSAGSKCKGMGRAGMDEACFERRLMTRNPPSLSHRTGDLPGLTMFGPWCCTGLYRRRGQKRWAPTVGG